MQQLWDVVQTKHIKRQVPVKNLDVGKDISAGGDTVKREIKLKMALDGETAKKVQAASQGDQVRISGPDRDDLQQAMTLLRSQDFGIALKFGNYR